MFFLNYIYFFSSYQQKSHIRFYMNISKKRKAANVKKVNKVKKETLCFLPIMAAVFYLTFGTPGNFFKQVLADGIDWWVLRLEKMLIWADVNETLQTLVIDGICAGIGSVLSFLPVIGLLFLCLFTLEECGYMKKVSQDMDRIFKPLGLPGRAIVPLLSGFGCSAAAILAAGEIPGRRARLRTIFLIPFMSCSAKIPIYGMIAAALFPQRAAAVIVFLYFFGIATAVLLAIVTRKLCREENDGACAGERDAGFAARAGCDGQSSGGRRAGGDGVGRKRLVVHTSACSAHTSGYRAGCRPISRVLLRTWENMRGFMKKAFTVIFLASAIIWTLENFDCAFHLAASPDQSMLASIGRHAAPLFKPLGFGDWRAPAALLAGLSAKEAVVSTLMILTLTAVNCGGVSGGAVNCGAVSGGAVSGGLVASVLSEVFTPLSALSFLIFCLLYLPCAATLATVYKVTGSRKYAAGMAVFQTALAWFAAFAVYHIGILAGLN